MFVNYYESFNSKIPLFLLLYASTSLSVVLFDRVRIPSLLQRRKWRQVTRVNSGRRSRDLVLINDRNWLTNERRVRRRVGVERTRVAHVVGLLAPLRQLHLYYVVIPSVEHQAHVTFVTETENETFGQCIPRMNVIRQGKRIVQKNTSNPFQISYNSRYKHAHRAFEVILDFFNLNFSGYFHTGKNNSTIFAVIFRILGNLIFHCHSVFHAYIFLITRQIPPI